MQLRVHRSGTETSCDCIGTVWKLQFTDEDFDIDLNQELYEECLERTRGVEEKDMTDVDEEELEEEQDPRVRTTSSGKILKLPNRFFFGNTA